MLKIRNFWKKQKPTQEEINKARTYLILVYGSMTEAAYRWSIAPKEERKRLYPAPQRHAILKHFKERSRFTKSTGPA